MFGLPMRKFPARPFLAVAAVMISAAVPGELAWSTPGLEAGQVAGADRTPEANGGSGLSRLAATLGRAVPDPNQGDEFTEVVANPDGTWSSTTASTPIRARDANGDWAPIDLSLKVEGGRVVPRNAPVEMSFSNGGDMPFAIADPVNDTSNRDVEWNWPSILPAPELNGNTATYKDAVDGGDLVVIANSTGFTHNVVLRKRPAEPVDIKVTVTTPAAQLKELPGGEMAIVDADGGKLASVPEPVMWDSSTDALGDPKVEPVDFTVETNPTDSGRPDQLILAPAEEFLSDPDTVYPVTVDPTFTLLAQSHAWATNEPGASFVGPTDLRAGFDGQYKSRAFLKFNGDATWDGTKVLSSKLYLRNWISGSCKAGAVRVYRVTSAWNADNISWSNMPTATATGAVDYSLAHGINDVCPNADAQWDITNIVQAWADNTAPNYGLRVGAADETNPNTFRRYRGMGWSANVPKIVTTYTRRPDPATAPSVSPKTVEYPVYGVPVDVTSSRTPTVAAKAVDPDGDQVRLRIRAYAEDAPSSELLAECTTPLGPSGSELTCQLPTLPNESMVFLRAKAVDSNGVWAAGSLESPSGWSSWHPVGVEAPVPNRAPDVPVGVKVSPASGVHGSLTPTLETWLADADVDDELQGEFAIYQGSTQVWTGTSAQVANGTAGAVDVPSGVLTAGETYVARARANDGAEISGWSDGITFTAQPLPSVPHDLTATPCNGACDTQALSVSSTTPTLSTTSRSPIATTVSLTWQLVSSDSKQVLATDVTTTTGDVGSWTIPTGVLHDNTSYFVRVEAEAATYKSGWSDYFEFSVQTSPIPSGPVDSDGDTTDPEADANGPAEAEQPTDEYQDMPTEPSPQDASFAVSSDPVLAAQSASDGTPRTFDVDTGPHIPYSGWAGCGVFDNKYKVVRDYGRYPFHPRMQRSYARLYCGIYKHEGNLGLFGFRHIKLRHLRDFQGWSWLIGRQWQDLAGWMMKWTLDVPDKATVASANRFCYQRRFFLMYGARDPKRVRVVMWLGETGVRIMSFAPTNPGGRGPCRGEESPISASTPDAS